MVIKLYSEYDFVPSYSKENDSGMDVLVKGFSKWENGSLVEVNTNRYRLESGESILIHTGLHFDIQKGYECQVRSRSGLALKQGLIVLNSPGTIDSKFHGECNVIIINHSSVHHFINIDDRIAQFVFAPVTKVSFEIVESVDEFSNSDRGQDGFGSTGVSS